MTHKCIMDTADDWIGTEEEIEALPLPVKEFIRNLFWESDSLRMQLSEEYDTGFRAGYDRGFEDGLDDQTEVNR